MRIIKAELPLQLDMKNNLVNLVTVFRQADADSDQQALETIVWWFFPIEFSDRLRDLKDRNVSATCWKLRSSVLPFYDCR